MLILAFDRPNQNIMADDTRVLRVRLRPDAAGGTRPLDVAVMLDASSSMRGDRFERAKDACREVARALRPDDRLSLGVFHGTATTMVEAIAGRDASAALDRALRGLQTGYGTRIDLALDWLATMTGTGGRAARSAVLVTDGYPFDAERRPVTDFSGLRRQAGTLAARGVTLTAIGLGPAADFHSGLLFDLCERGGGAFLQAETADTLAARLLETLRPAQRVVETAARMTVAPQLKNTRLDGACRVHPLYMTLPVKPAGTDWVVPLGDLEIGDNDFLLRLSVPAPGAAAPQGSRPVVSVVVEAGERRFEASAAIHFTRDYRLTQEVNADVDRARLLCFVEEKIHDLRESDDPARTHRLAAEIEDVAGHVGRPDIQEEAARLRRELEEKGVASDEHLSRVFQSARRRKPDQEG